MTSEIEPWIVQIFCLSSISLDCRTQLNSIMTSETEPWIVQIFCLSSISLDCRTQLNSVYRGVLPGWVLPIMLYTDRLLSKVRVPFSGFRYLVFVGISQDEMY